MMKKLICMTTVAMVAGFAVVSKAEDVERGSGRGGAGHGRLENNKHGAEEQRHHKGNGRGHAEGVSREDMMLNTLRNPQVAEKMGLSEEQRKKIEKKLEQLEDSHLDLKYKMEKAALKQARLMTAKKLDEEALMDVIEEMGGYRTKMAKQRIQLIIFMRETLTPEQIDTMRDMMRKRMKARHKEHSKKSAQDERRGSKRGGHSRDEHRPARQPERP